MTPEQTEQLHKIDAWEQAENYLPNGKTLRYRLACDTCMVFPTLHTTEGCRSFIYNHEDHKTRII